MSRQDIVTKDYMEDTSVFADVFNHLIYKGEKVIDPKKLRTLDTAEISVPYGADGSGVPIQKFRDKLKVLAAMEDDEAAYLLLGLENQSEVHYAMPVKAMVYDGLQYAGQVERAAKSHREAAKQQAAATREVRRGTDDENAGEFRQNGKEKKLSAGEYLTGFYKEDRLIPVITLVLHFGTEPWDGPKSLHEMLAVQDEELLKLIPDYRINLISPSAMTEEEIGRFRTSLREVMLYIKYAKDKKKLKALLESDERFQTMDLKAARVINAVTGSRIKFHIGKEEKDVGWAIDEIVEEKVEERLEERVKVRLAEQMERINEQLEEKKEEMRRESREESLRTSIHALMKNLGWTAVQAMTALDIPAIDMEKYMKKL